MPKTNVRVIDNWQFFQGFQGFISSKKGFHDSHWFALKFSSTCGVPLRMCIFSLSFSTLHHFK